MQSISLPLNAEPNVIGLAPILQKSLDSFCDVLPKNNVWVQSKFTDVVHQLSTLLNDQPRFKGAAGVAFVNRVGLYVLWRSIVQQYIGPSLGISTEFQNLCKRCPPLGISISSNGNVIPFLSRYTCKHYLCPSCRMRKILALWNKLNHSLQFTPNTEVDLVHFEVVRTFTFTGASTGDFGLEMLQDLLKQFKAMLWTCGGAWSIGLTTKESEVTLTAKCGAVCPPLPTAKQLKLKKFATGVTYAGAMTEQDIYGTLIIERATYDLRAAEKLFAKTLNTSVWPASIMLDCADSISPLFALRLDTAFRNQKTIGSFGPCDTVRKRLKKAL